MSGMFAKKNKKIKMHTIAEVETNVPAFLGKLWKLVEDPETNDLICWAPNGRSFFIRNTARFARELLPHYYKHNNMASFVRQLNMYGFHKKVSVELGGLKCDKDEMEFAHQYFIKGHSYLLEHIKRKIASNKSQESHPPVKTEVMNKVLSEVRTMRGRQEQLDNRIGAMKRENEALWRELAMLRRKHLKQQEIVNKLIHFLVTLVQPSRGGGLTVKRRGTLMIDHHQRSKQMKMNKDNMSEPSPTGPVIHELDGTEQDHHDSSLDSEYIVAEILENQQNPSVQSPQADDTDLDDGNTEMVHYVRPPMSASDEMEILESLEAAPKKKSSHKSKKKRKNKVPIKIHIPAQDDEEPREETIMIDVGSNEALSTEQVDVKKPKQTKMKPLPMKGVRSSKLAAMAANINKMNDSDELEMDSENEDEPKELEDVSEVDTDLNNILIIPDMLESQQEQLDNDQNIEVNIRPDDSNKDANSSQDDTQNKVNVEENTDAGSSDKSQDLSLSCFNPSSLSNNNYRLGPVEEMDTHLEKTDKELNRICDLIRSESPFFTINADAFFSLLPNENDPMSIGRPLNPELDSAYRDKDNYFNEVQNGPTSGELMAYNSSSNLDLDFDPEMFLTANNLDSNSQDVVNQFYGEESLDSLVSGNANTSKEL